MRIEGKTLGTQTPGWEVEEHSMLDSGNKHLRGVVGTQGGSEGQEQLVCRVATEAIGQNSWHKKN